MDDMDTSKQQRKGVYLRDFLKPAFGIGYGLSKKEKETDDGICEECELGSIYCGWKSG